MEAKNFHFEEISIGSTATFTRTWNNEDIEAFAKVSGDFNPLHMDSEYAEHSKYKQRIVHGMLNASLFSTLVGMYLPGKRCLYLSQSLFFKEPVFINDSLTITGTVVAKSNVTQLLTIRTIISKEDKIVVEGEAKVQILSDI